jgi:hypothetical protein
MDRMMGSNRPKQDRESLMECQNARVFSVPGPGAGKMGVGTDGADTEGADTGGEDG